MRAVCVALLVVFPLTGYHFYRHHRTAKAGGEPELFYGLCAACTGARNEESPSADLVVNVETPSDGPRVVGTKH